LKEFNYDSIIALGEFNSSEKLELTVFQDGENQIYTFIWDDFDKFNEWKIINGYTNAVVEIEKLYFIDVFLLKNTLIDYVFLNPDSSINDFSTAIERKTDYLKNSSAYDCLPLIMSGFDDKTTQLLIRLYVLANKDILPSYLFDQFPKIVQTLASKGSNIGQLFEVESQECDLAFEKLHIYDENGLSKASIKFFGHFIEISGENYTTPLYAYYKSGCHLDRLLNQMPNDGKLYIKPDIFFIIHCEEIVEINIQTPLFSTAPEINKKIINFYEKIHEKTLVDIGLYNSAVNEFKSILASDNEITAMASNFVKDYGLPIYYEFNRILLMDIVIYETFSSYGIKSLLSERSISLIEDFNENKNLLSTENGVVLEFFNKFLVFAEYIANKYSSVADLTVYSVYSLLLEEFINYAENDFKNSFKEQLPEINVLEEYSIIEMIVNDNHGAIDNKTLFNCAAFLMQKKIIKCDGNILDCVLVLLTNCQDYINNENKNSLIKSLQTNKDVNKIEITINEVDMMSGYEFENFISELFGKMGYITEVTKASGDQGIDVIAYNANKKVGIQSKCYSGTVGNSAIQEAAAGKNYYGLDKVIVVTNSFFTESAIKLAEANSVILWNRDILKAKINDLY
jgi:HJR/Mrr/RecB family endonuclease